MDETDQNDGLAVVLPIRPGIQPGDTTPFGTTASDPTADLGETWGTTPQRRMTADPVSDAQTETDEPASVATAATTDQRPSASARSRDGAWPHPPRGWVPGPRAAWLIGVPSILGLLAGGAIALTTSQGARHPNTPSATIAQHAHARSPDLAAESARAVTKSSQTTAFSQREARHQLSGHAGRPPTKPHTRHRTPTATTTFVTHTLLPTSGAGNSQPTADTYRSPVSDSEQTQQTPAATAASHTSAPVSGEAHTPPAGPTGANAILGPGHCSC